MKDYINKFAGNFITGIAGFITSILLPITLGVESYGIFVYVQRFANTYFEISDVGVSAAVSTSLNNDSQEKRHFLSYVIYSTIILLVGIIAIIIYGVLFQKEFATILLCGLLYFYANHLISAYNKIFDSIKKTSLYELTKTSFKIGVLISLLLLFYLKTPNLKLLFICFSAVGVLGIALIFYPLYRANPEYFILLRRDQIKGYYTFISAVSLPSVLAIMSLFLDTYVVKATMGNSALGQFGVSQSFGGLTALILMSMISILIRDYAHSFRDTEFATVAYELVVMTGLTIAVIGTGVITILYHLDIEFNKNAFIYSSYLLLYFSINSFSRYAQNLLFLSENQKEWAKVSLVTICLNIGVDLIIFFYKGVTLEMFFVKQYGVVILYWVLLIIRIRKINLIASTTAFHIHIFAICIVYVFLSFLSSNLWTFLIVGGYLLFGLTKKLKFVYKNYYNNSSLRS